MSKVTKETLYKCDICNSKIHYLESENTFYYTLGWSSGSHYGRTEQEGHVCDKCLEGSRLKRFMAKLFTKAVKDAV